MTLRLHDLAFHKFVAEHPSESLPDDGMVIKRSVTAVPVSVADDRTAPFVISNPATDRSGDSFVDAKGWQLGDYLKNPIVLWDHNPHEPPVAKAVATYIEENALKSVAFFPADVSPLSETVYKMLKLGLLNACSVGFRPLEWKRSTRTIKLGDFEINGVDFYKQLLLEWSIVSVPDNPEALIQQKGLDLRPYAEWAQKALDTNGAVTATREQLESVHKALGVKRVTSVPLINEPNKETDMKTKAGRVLSEKNLAAVKDALGALDSMKLAHKSLADAHKSAVSFHKASLDHLDKCFKALDGLRSQADDVSEEDTDEPDKETKEAGKDPVDADRDGDFDDKPVDETKGFSLDDFKSALSTAFAPSPEPEILTRESFLEVIKNVARDLTETQITKARGK